MKIKSFQTICCALIMLAGTYSLNAQQQTIDLSGAWQVSLETKSTATIEKTKGTIQLPSSLAEQGFGIQTQGADTGVLTPKYKYIGTALYSKTIYIPKSWENKAIELFLERVLWSSKVSVDGHLISEQDALGTPHIHSLGKLSPGKHTLSIAVNNEMIHNIGDKGHAYSDFTQGIWNGMVGKLELRMNPDIRIKQIRTFPILDKEQVKIELLIQGIKKTKAKVAITIMEVGQTKTILETTRKVDVIDGEHTVELFLNTENRLKKWNEFKPVTYLLKTELTTKKNKALKETEFGYLEIGHNGTQITINDKPVFLRGNLDCVHFPLTGYPSTKVADWERIFKKHKEYGLNHVRFHSWCPPEAAFKAANRIGIYLQVEASVWIDSWMNTDMSAIGRPEMDTKGRPVGLGKDASRDAFVIKEMNRVVNTYGNHPSFTMFCIGNELGSSNFDVTKEWISELKAHDPRRLYAASTARTITESDDYNVTHYIPNIGHTRGLRGARTDWDFEEVYAQMNIPILAHEIGQWPVYPSWKEIDKYTGVFQARNFQQFKAVAEKNGIAEQAEDFKMASGALNQIMYKYEIESFLRTKSCAGIQLLSMQDYQGQGEALVGWLDTFWDSKGITTSEKFKQHSNETVPLLRIPKFIWSSNETLSAKIQVSHYGQHPIKSGTVLVTVQNDTGNKVFEKRMNPIDFSVGSLMNIGTIQVPLSKITKAERLSITLTVENTDFKNSWNIWVYPKALPKLDFKDNPDVLISTKMDAKTITALEKGKKVLLLAYNLGTEKNSVPVNYYPLYWSLTFFPGQGKTSIGMLFNKEHEVFKYFPTDFHSDWQWQPFEKNTKAFVLNSLPKSYKPLAQVIDDFHLNNKQGTIFELAVGKGKLLVCGYNLQQLNHPAANQLEYSLLKYLKSDSFKPTTQVSQKFLKELFPLDPLAENVTTVKKSGNTLLKVLCGGATQKKGSEIPWKKSNDSILVQAKNTDYKIISGNISNDEQGKFWSDKEMSVSITCPNGILGSLYIRFDDSQKLSREGIIEFEGRKIRLEPHAEKEGKWIKFHVMREDSNDGVLLLKMKATSESNLKVSQLILETK